MENNNKIKINTLEICMKQLQNNFAKFENKFDKFEDNIRTKFDSMEEKLEKKFVTKKEFGPIQKIVYSAIGAILLWVGGKLLGLL